MFHYETSIVIDRPVEEVFAYMEDIYREREWQPYIREVQRIPADGGGVGTIRRYTNHYLGRSFENVYETTVYEPNQRVAYSSTPEAAVQATGETRWEAVEEGTRVTMVFDPDVAGFYSYLPNRIVDWIYRRQLNITLARLKKRLESSDET